MGNTISLDICKQNFSMSNGLTDVFISVLGLSGTRLAQNDIEKRMIVWLLEKDQSVVGSGTVGFDICEMPWEEASFEELKCFLLNVIEKAKKKGEWEFLDYQPDDGLLIPCLDQFYKLISIVDVSMIDRAAAQEWLDDTMESPNNPIRCGYPQCQKHPVLLTEFGCYLCNN